MADELTMNDAKEIFIKERGRYFDIVSIEKEGNKYQFVLKRKDGSYAYASISDNFRHTIIAPG